MRKQSGLTKFLLYQLPYIFYISILLYWFYNTYEVRNEINYIAMGAAMIVFSQFVLQIKLIGASLGIIGILFSSMFFFSQISQFKQHQDQREFFVLGLVIISLSLIMGLIITITNLKAISRNKDSR